MKVYIGSGSAPEGYITMNDPYKVYNHLDQITELLLNGLTVDAVIAQDTVAAKVYAFTHLPQYTGWTMMRKSHVNATGKSFRNMKKTFQMVNRVNNVIQVLERHNFFSLFYADMEKEHILRAFYNDHDNNLAIDGKFTYVNEQDSTTLTIFFDRGYFNEISSVTLTSDRPSQEALMKEISLELHSAARF